MALPRLMPSTPQNRTASAAALIAVLAFGALACAWQAVRANGMATRERQARERESALREQAESQAREAEARDMETQMVLAFFQTEVLTTKSPAGIPQLNITLREALDRAEPVIAEHYSAQPLLEAAIRSALSVSYQHLQKFDAAISQLQQAVDLRRQALGPNHPATLGMLNNLGVTYQRAGRHEHALPLLEETLRLKVAALGAGDREAFVGANNLALAYLQIDNPDRAVALLEPAIEQTWAKQNPTHPETLTGMHTLARAYQDSKQFEKAIARLEEMLRHQRAADPHGVTTLRIMQQFVNTLHLAGEPAKAESMCRELTTMYEAQFGPDHRDTCLARVALTLNLLEQRKYTSAEQLLRQCLLAKNLARSEPWLLFNIQSLLGAAILGQAREQQSSDSVAASEKFRESERLLLAGYQGLASADKDVPSDGQARLTEALQRLIDLYTVWNKPTEAANWRKELDAITAEPIPRGDARLTTGH